MNDEKDIGVENNAQTRKNLIFNIFNLFANVLIGLLYTPYLVRHLGIVAYGVVPLVLIINQYISVLTGSLTSSLTRFYSVAVQQGKLSEASKCINTALGVVLIFFVALIVPVYFFIARVDTIFTIPPELVEQSKVLFSLTISSFFLSLVSSVLNINLYANNRLDYLNVVNIVRSVSKFGFVLLLFTFLDNDITYVGAANILTEVVVLFLSLYAFRKISGKEIKINVKHFDKVILLSMLGMTTWVMVIQIGDTGLYRIDNVIVNIFWSTTETGIVGAYSELGTYIMVGLSVFSSIFGPLILMAYSKGKHEEVVQMAVDRSLLVGVIAAVIAGVAIGFSSQISRVWLGEGFETFHVWLVLKLVLIPFYTSSGVFSFIYRAWNRMKVPALISLVLGGINLLIAVLVAKFMSPGYTAIVIILAVGSLLGIMQSYVLNGWYVSKIYPAMRRPVFKNFMLIALILVVISVLSYGVNLIFPYRGVVMFLVVGGVVAVILFACTFRLAFTSKQRSYLRNLINIKRSA